MSCTIASHEAMKQDRQVLLALTEPAGAQQVGDDLIEQRRCLACGSTIAVPVAPKAWADTPLRTLALAGLLVAGLITWGAL